MLLDYKDKRDSKYPDPAEYELSCMNDVYQSLSRVFRTMDNICLKKVAIVFDENAFNGLKKLMPSWNYVEVKDQLELLLGVRFFVEPYPVKKVKILKLRAKLSEQEHDGVIYPRYIVNVPTKEVQGYKLKPEFILNLELTEDTPNVT